jgi:hypothetical protein
MTHNGDKNFLSKQKITFRKVLKLNNQLKYSKEGEHRLKRHLEFLLSFCIQGLKYGWHYDTLAYFATVYLAEEFFVSNDK